MHHLLLKSLKKLAWILALSLISKPVFAWDDFKDYLPGRVQLESTTDYFQAASNYTSQGTTLPLPDGNSYNLWTTDFGARWTPTIRWGFYALGQAANSTAKNLTTTNTNSSLTGVKVGSDFLMYSRRRLRFIPELSATFPIKRTDPSSINSLNSENDLEITAKMTAQKELSFMRDFLYAGYTFRDENRSCLGIYGGGAEFKFWTPHYLGIGLEGFSSVTQDTSNNLASKEIIAATVDGGSLKFYSVNPSVLTAHGWYKWDDKNNFVVKIAAGTSLNGAHYASGWDASVNLEYSFQDVFKSSKKKAAGKPSEPAFKEDTNDDANQQYFQQ